MSESNTEKTESTSSQSTLSPEPQTQQESSLESLKSLEYLSALPEIAQSLAHLLETSAPTTPVPGNEATLPPVVEPPTEIPASAEADTIILPDGRTAPAAVVRALAEYDENVWPGALNPKARAAVAHVVIQTIEGNLEPVLRTNYAFCLDPNPGGLSYESPCILRAEHPGKHRDNNDGTW